MLEKKLSKALDELMDKATSVKFAQFNDESSEGNSEDTNSDDGSMGQKILELQKVNRPPMNQEQFDQKFAYVRPKSESQLKRSMKKYFRRYQAPFTSLYAFNKFLKSTIPILDWLPNYSIREDLFYDIVGGITLGVMHIPQGIAYSSLAGLPPVNGLYTSLFPVLVYMFFGTSRQCSVGSFAVVALMTGGAVKSVVADHSEYIGHEAQITAMLCMQVGLIQFLVGFVGLSFITTYFSDEVVSGFTTGAAIHVFSLQLKDIFGIHLNKTDGISYLPQMYVELFRKIGEGDTNWVTVGMAACTIVLLLIGREILNPLLQKKCKLPVPIPFEILMVIFGTLFSALFHLHSKHDVKIVNHIPSDIPPPAIPHFSLFVDLVKAAIPIAVVNIAVHISLAKMFAKKFNYKVDANQEFYAMGLTGIISGFFPVFPPACSMARTVVNANTGTRTQLSALISSAVILFVILFAGPWLRTLPMCVLAAIIAVALKSLLEKFGSVPALWKVSKIDCSIWIVACVATIFIDVTYGLITGIIYALFTTIIREQWPRWHVLANIGGNFDYRDAERYRDAFFFNGTCILRFDSPLLFTNVNRFKDTVNKMVQALDNQISTIECDEKPIRNVIVDCSGFAFIDLMGVNTLKDVFVEMEERGVKMYIAAAKAPLREMFESGDLYKFVPKSAFYPTIFDAVAFATKSSQAGGGIYLSRTPTYSFVNELAHTTDE
ncbi:unnamed protein product, partial [Mesorhabditis belari]|uniref:STAS domain-containing protein n=1 Tax=Mesorhabditis belari TaxID=2138241 RepID=A0AAF3EP06_9BILA